MARSPAESRSESLRAAGRRSALWLAAISLAALAATLLAPGQARAQSWPARPIVWVVPFTPSGITDNTARTFAKRLSELLGQSVVIENRPGAGIRMTHVPYKGSAPAITDLLGGNVDLVFDYAVALVPHIKAGKLRALAVTGSGRLDSLPDVPTIAQLGYPQAESMSWSGILLPAGTPPEVVHKLAQACATALADPAVTKVFERTGSAPLNGLAEDKFRAFIVDEIAKWGEAVRKSGAVAQ